MSAYKIYNERKIPKFIYPVSVKHWENKQAKNIVRKLFKLNLKLQYLAVPNNNKIFQIQIYGNKFCFHRKLLQSFINSYSKLKFILLFKYTYSSFATKYLNEPQNTILMGLC